MAKKIIPFDENFQNGKKPKGISPKITASEGVVEAIEEWKNKKRMITMTNEEWEFLLGYIHISGAFIRDQINAWKELSEQKATYPDGRLIYPHAERNYERLSEMKAAADRFKAKMGEPYAGD